MNDPLKLDMQNGFFMIASTKIFAIKSPYDTIEGVSDISKLEILKKLYPNTEFRKYDRCMKSLVFQCQRYLELENKTLILTDL